MGFARFLFYGSVGLGTYGIEMEGMKQTINKRIMATNNVAEIKKQYLIDQLEWNDSADADEVYVSVKDQTVRLSGTVPNYRTKMTVELDAYLVPGVMNVENFLEVEYPPDAKLPADDSVRENIGKMLNWNGNIDSTNIRVSVEKGKVTLSGTVGSYWERYVAEEVAFTAYGVTDVSDNLMVDPGKTVNDTDIEKDINDALQRNVLIDEDQLEVEVNAGIVHLTGNLPDFFIKNQAVNAAAYTSGVRDVIDSITIG
jgi:osmotically-inducible protein OsmY